MRAILVAAAMKLPGRWNRDLPERVRRMLRAAPAGSGPAPETSG